MDIGYAAVRTGKLKLKSGKKKSKKHSKHHSHRSKSKQVTDPRIADAELHGGWWGVNTFSDVSDSIAVQFDGWSADGNLALADSNEPTSTDSSQPPPVNETRVASCYLSATDDGMFVVGPPRYSGEPPNPEEIFTAVRLSDSKVAFKSGYGKYLGVSTESESLLIAIADAIGPREQFEPVFQEDRAALLGVNNCFLVADPKTGDVSFTSQQAKLEEMITIRSNRPLIHDPLLDLPVEERQGLMKAEVNYVKKFQSWQDHKLRLSKDEKSALRDAKRTGELHECFLDRREKMKSDRYCK